MSAARGIRVGISGALGHGLGITIFALTTVFGLSALLIAMPELTTALTLAGVLLLLYFGYQLTTARPLVLPERLTTQGGFIAGFFIAIVNPKVLVFFLAVFGPFVEPTHSVKTQLSMGALAGGIDALIYMCVAVTGMALRQVLDANRIRLINRLIGYFLILSGLWIFIQEISNLIKMVDNLN